MSPTQKNSLTQTLETIKNSSQGKEISFHDIIKELNHRGFGPLLIAPSLIIVLPTGAVPGIPAVCAVIIILMSVQMLFGRRYPWIPKKIEHISFNREDYIKGIKKIKPFTEKLDHLFKPRLQFLTHHISQRILAFISTLLALSILLVGFIPFAPMFPALTILLFGLGISVKDGLVTSIGIVVFIFTCVLIPLVA